jgi:hypothetical protein
MSPVYLQLRMPPAPANRLLAKVSGEERAIRIPVPHRRRLGGGTPVLTGGNVSLFVKAHTSDAGLVIDVRFTAGPPSTPPAPAAALRLRMQTAPADLVRTAVRGEPVSVYIPAAPDDEPVSGAGWRIYHGGLVSLFARASRGEGGLVIELCFVPGLPPAASAALPAA